MESKVNSILNIIIPDEENRRLFNDMATYDYLTKLGNSTFDQILSEPMCLNDETKTLTEQTQELALNNYRTFIETAECATNISKDFEESKSSLGEFIDKVPKFMSECESFSSTSKEILKERGFNDQIKYQSEQLLGILELPILMQTALNNGEYGCALDLFTYIRNLSRKYNDLSAVQNIASEVTKLWFETLHRLFNQLRHDLPLPQCLQILGYLRRANVVYESTMDDINSPSEFESNIIFKSNKLKNIGDGLQLHFLKARGNWFDSALTDSMEDDSDKHLRKIVELHRIHLFNILTQHKAIFLSETQSKLKGDDLNGIAALSCWLKEKVNKLKSILEYNISQEDDASFESLFSQCMYLCLSFGRVGADMRGVMAPMFRDIIYRCFSESISKANSHFESELRQYKIVVQNKAASKTINEVIDQNQNSPPESLLEFYPLAEYCNNVLCALNVLRVTSPLCLVMKVLDELTHSLTNISKSLLSHFNREQQSFSDIEKDQYISYCIIFKDELIPYLQKCISQIFPPASIAEQLGISMTMIQEEKLINLDIDKITLSLIDVINIKTI